ncbi:MAG: hypothetical protein AB7I38_11135 [Dehalococcoidia bacterium]
MASKRAQRRHECTRKKPYATEAEAHGALRGAERAGRVGVATLHVYRCRNGGAHFHVGHLPAGKYEPTPNQYKALLRGRVRLKGVAA